MTPGIDFRTVGERMAQHQRVAFQLSGGRDSVAALYAMRSWWGQMTVYHLDTGDRFPEVAAVVEAISRQVPVLAVKSSAQDFRSAYGDPADVVPVDNEPLGRMVSGNAVGILSRYTCCANVIMAPMHARMRADGITLIVRGQRASDYHREPAPQGVALDGVELLFPIHEWSSSDVDAFVAQQGLPVAPFYREGMSSTPDCMGCTAWLSEGRLAYMRRHHPEAAMAVAAKVQTIRAEVARQLSTFEEVTP